MSTEFKNVYIHETECLSCSNGELYITGEDFEIVWNTETLFTDLPYIIKMVFASREETNKRIKDQLKEQLEELTRLVTI